MQYKQCVVGLSNRKKQSKSAKKTSIPTSLYSIVKLQVKSGLKVLRNGWKTIVSQFNCGGKSLVGSAALANFLDHAHNYNVVDEFTTISLPTV